MIISLPLSVIGLAGLSDALIAWKGFIANAIDLFHSITHPFYYFLFGWLPFSFPTWFFDYLTIGALVVASMMKGFMSAKRQRPWGKIIAMMSLSLIVLCLIWPFVLLSSVATARMKIEREGDSEVVAASRYSLLWLASVALCFALLVGVNAAFLK